MPAPRVGWHEARMADQKAAVVDDLRQLAFAVGAGAGLGCHRRYDSEKDQPRPGVKVLRDPMSLPFHVNFCYGLRFVQVSALVSPREAVGPARALPVHFDVAPPANKPKKNASDEAWENCQEEQNKRTLSLAGVEALSSLRTSLDQRPETSQLQLIACGDGSYTNRTVMRSLPDRTLLGVAQGQVWNPDSVRRLPQLQVAGYGLLLLASILSSGFQRTDEYLPLPKWRRKSIRPSLLDLLALVRDPIFSAAVAAPVLNFEDFANISSPAAKLQKQPLASETLCTLAA
jgi:hypothetical protein